MAIATINPATGQVIKDVRAAVDAQIEVNFRRLRIRS